MCLWLHIYWSIDNPWFKFNQIIEFGKVYITTINFSYDTSNWICVNFGLNQIVLISYFGWNVINLELKAIFVDMMPRIFIRLDMIFELEFEQNTIIFDIIYLIDCDIFWVKFSDMWYTFLIDYDIISVWTKHFLCLELNLTKF